MILSILTLSFPNRFNISSPSNLHPIPNQVLDLPVNLTPVPLGFVWGRIFRPQPLSQGAQSQACGTGLTVEMAIQMLRLPHVTWAQPCATLSFCIPLSPSPCVWQAMLFVFPVDIRRWRTYSRSPTRWCHPKRCVYWFTNLMNTLPS